MGADTLANTGATMDIKSTPSTAAAATTTRAGWEADKATMQNAIAKVNKFLEEGPGGIFKPLNDFMAKMPSQKEILSNIK